MLNRPFSSITNIIDEITQNSTPATICGQNVMVSQEQHQKTFNTLTTSIAGMQGSYPSSYQNYPNAVTFTFNNQGYQQQPYWQCPTPVNPTLQSINQMQQANAVDLMTLQRQLNQPYQWRFHLDSQTSTTDLRKKNVRVRADLRNLAGALNNKWPEWLQAPMSKNPKKLILKNVTAKVEGNVYDGLDKEEKKRVGFADDQKNAEVQVKLCCEDNEEPAKPKKRKKKKSVKNTSSSSDWSPNEDPK